MPRYGYRCQVCEQEFELVRPMRDSGRTAECPAGHPGAQRTFGGVVTPAVAAERPSLDEIQARHHLQDHGHAPGHGHSH